MKAQNDGMAPMTPTRTCSRCGTTTAAADAAGLCPKCLLAVSLYVDLSDPLLAAGGSDRNLIGSRGASLIPTAGRRFGDYELLEEIARGGMGVVYKARQVNLNRIVALKMLVGGPFSSEVFRQRFRAEAGTAAKLRHANVVTIYEIGQHEGLDYFSMDCVEGPNLTEAVREQPMSSDRAAACVQSIAQAIEYAHQHDVLHRDLKPSNVLLDLFDQPHITDFGLAKQIGDVTDLTVTGQVLGSPSFMSPEQGAGEPTDAPLNPARSPRRGAGGRRAGEGSRHGTARVGPRSDVYGIGAILYYLLTGRAPFVSETFAATLNLVQTAEPIRPRLLSPAVPADLETICLKCLEKEPAKRYGTAQELADDLGRFLRDEPILARPVTRVERVWRWCRRKPALASALVLVLLLVLVVGIGSPIAAYRINQERRKAEAQAYTSDMNVVLQAWEEGNLKRAQTLLRAHIPKRGEPDLRGFEWRYLWNLCQDESRYAFTNFDQSIGGLAFSPDGTFLAAGAGHVAKLLDKRTEPGHFRKLVPKTLPSGRPPLLFQFQDRPAIK